MDMYEFKINRQLVNLVLKLFSL